MNYDLYWVWLSLGLGAGASCLDLVSYYEWNPYEIYGSTLRELFQLNVVGRRQLERLKSFPIEKAEEILSVSREKGWKILTPSSKDYPQKLITLQDVKLIVNEAILSNDKRSKKSFGGLFTKTKDKEGNIILKEKDFTIN